MKKQKMQLLILGGLAIFVLAAFLILRNGQKADAGTDEENTSYAVISLNEEDLESFTVINAGTMYAFQKGKDGWESEQKAAGTLDQDKLEAMFSQVISLRADDKIENVSDLSGFGLETPEVSVTLMTADGAEYRILFGDYNEITGVYYFGLSGSDVVYTTPINLKGSFQMTWEDLEKK